LWKKSQNQGSSGAKEIQGIKIFQALKRWPNLGTFRIGGEASLGTKFVIFSTMVIPKNKSMTQFWYITKVLKKHIIQITDQKITSSLLVFS
jgi:hypothetical protein